MNFGQDSMSSYLNRRCLMFWRLFRFNHTLTQNLIMFGSLGLLFCFYYCGGHQKLIESVKCRCQKVNARDNWTIHKSGAPHQQILDTKKTSPTTTTEDSSTLSFKSTCSAAADRRGPNQNVIGYSMYGNFSDPTFYNSYLKWFGETLRTIPIKYPGA
jgi:hypothetical protein